MTRLIIDGKEIDAPPEFTLLQACEAAGAEIPRFCYHEKLPIAANCRMCMVEMSRHCPTVGRREPRRPIPCCRSVRMG